jgi:hypothetical protein
MHCFSYNGKKFLNSRMNIFTDDILMALRFHVLILTSAQPVLGTTTCINWFRSWKELNKTEHWRPSYSDCLNQRVFIKLYQKNKMKFNGFMAFPHQTANLMVLHIINQKMLTGNYYWEDIKNVKITYFLWPLLSTQRQLLMAWFEQGNSR